MPAHNNGLGHCPDIEELEDLCVLEVMLVLFICIVCKMEGA